jgi:hypothetical protein
LPGAFGAESLFANLSRMNGNCDRWEERRTSRRVVLHSLGAGTFALAAPACFTTPAGAVATAQTSLDRGLAWLLKQQADDGGWHSETYGALRQGAAITSLVLYTLAHLPPEIRKTTVKAARKGFAYLEPGIKKRGFVASPDGSLDYPTYSTALLVTAARSLDFGLTAPLQEKLLEWVASGQLHESREFTEKSPHYGGWDLMGASLVLGLTSDTNVSATCFALEAIHEARIEAIQKTLARARRWAAGCQNPADGGFAFSPDPMSINHKAGYADDQQTKPQSYGSATCDGLRCLLYAGTKQDEAAVKAALKWLVDHPQLKAVPGFKDPDDVNGWGMGLRLYYYQSLAKLLRYFDARERTARMNALRDQIQSLQQPDGRWQNESSRMREDDPLIATCLALIAWGALTA